MYKMGLHTKLKRIGHKSHLKNTCHMK